MEKTVKEIDSSKREIEISLTKEELQPHFDKAYHRARPSIDIKGFRKGKVPVNVIKKFYGPQIEGEALQDISSETFNDVMKEEKQQVVGQPQLRDIQNTDDGGKKFVIYYEVLPEFELGDYKSLTVEEPVHPVADEEIDEEIKQICINSGNLEDAEEITDEMHVAEVKLYEMDDETGMALVGSKPQETKVFLAGENVIPALKNNLMNAKVGHNFNFRPIEFDESAPDKTFQVTVTGIQKLIPQEFDNEFVKKYSEGKFETTDEYKEEIGFRIQEQWDQKSRQEVEDQIINKLVDMHSEFDVPESIVWNVMTSMAEDIKKQYANIPQAKELTVEEMAPDLRPLAERSVRWEIIRTKIMEKEDIKVEDHDVEHIAEMEAARQNIDKDLIMKSIMNNQNFTQNILTKKIMDFLIDFTTTEEIPFEDFKKGAPAEPDDDEDEEVETEDKE